jgi:hypothetical protein
MPRSTRTTRTGTATLRLNPSLVRDLRASEPVRQLLDVWGHELAGEMREQTKTDVAQTRARNLQQNGRAYKPTGRLAASWSHAVRKEDGGWVLYLGSGTAQGVEPIEYAGVYVWGYDPTGPRAHVGWGGNDVFEKAFRRHGITYRSPY